MSEDSPSASPSITYESIALRLASTFFSWMETRDALDELDRLERQVASELAPVLAIATRSVADMLSTLIVLLMKKEILSAEDVDKMLNDFKESFEVPDSLSEEAQQATRELSIELANRVRETTISSRVSKAKD